MILTIASVIKQPALGFDSTRESVLREFGKQSDVEYLIKEYSDSESESDSLGVRVVRGPDTGVFDGMNQAIAAATGDWVLFLNAGDWLAQGTGKAICNAIARHPDTEFLYFDGVTVDANDGREFLRVAPDVLDLRNFLLRAPVLHPSLIVKRDILDQYRFDLDYDLAADFDLMVRLVADKRKGAHIPRNGAFVLSGGLSEQFRVRARWQAMRSLLSHGMGFGFHGLVVLSFLRFLFLHMLIVYIIRPIPALRKRAQMRSSGMPAGSYE